MALHALELQALDHRVQPLQEEGLGGDHVAGPLDDAAVTAGPCELDVVGVRTRPLQARPRQHEAAVAGSPGVQAERSRELVALQEPARDHLARARDDLFGGLEDEQEGSR